MQSYYNTTYCIPYAIYYIPVAASLYNWRLITLNPLHRFHSLSPQHPDFLFILCAYKVLMFDNSPYT